MNSTLIPIGDSRRMQTPKPSIEQCATADEVGMDMQAGKTLIHAPLRPREGWEDAFQQMARAGDDQLLDGQVASTPLDDEEREWK